MKSSDQPLLSSRFSAALLLAVQLHRTQLRKGSGVPYVAHLLGVTALVLEDGGDEDQAIAALLHDAVEDQGGRETLARIRAQFGERVAEIVAGCTDTYENPKPPWRGRKEGYLQHLWQADEDVLLVSLADKVHNARSILHDLRTQGENLWERFRGGKDGTLWYYRALVDVFEQRITSPLVADLVECIAAIERLAQGDQDAPHE